jgi:CheY-like chemotaxis protein
MNVLIVEDQDAKRGQLRAFLLEAFAGATIIEARSLSSGLSHILAGAYDLVLLDMTMPTHDPSPSEPGGRPQRFAGRELLDQMGRLGVTPPTVIVTQYDSFGAKGLDDLSAELKAEHPEFYRGAVHYNPAVSGWKTGLAQCIRDLPGFREPMEVA